MPFEFFISRLCDEFKCLPSEAEREWRNAPVGWLEDIIEARAFAEMKRTMESTTDAEQLRKLKAESSLARMVETIEFEIVRESLGPTAED